MIASLIVYWPLAFLMKQVHHVWIAYYFHLDYKLFYFLAYSGGVLIASVVHDALKEKSK